MPIWAIFVLIAVIKVILIILIITVKTNNANKRALKKVEAAENERTITSFVKEEIRILPLNMRKSLLKKGYLKKIGNEYFLESYIDWKQIKELYEMIRADRHVVWINKKYYGFDIFKDYLDFLIKRTYINEDKFVNDLQKITKKEAEILLKEKFIEKQGNKYILSKEKKEELNNYWNSFYVLVEEIIEVLKKGE